MIGVLGKISNWYNFPLHGKVLIGKVCPVEFMHVKIAPIKKEKKSANPSDMFFSLITVLSNQEVSKALHIFEPCSSSSSERVKAGLLPF